MALTTITRLIVQMALTIPDTVVFRELDGEAVLLNLDSGACPRDLGQLQAVRSAVVEHLGSALTTSHG